MTVVRVTLVAKVSLLFMQQNQQFQRVLDYEKMVELTYLPVEETPDDAVFISLQQIMGKLEKLFPSFIIRGNTNMELGKRLNALGYEHKKTNKGASYRMKER